MTVIQMSDRELPRLRVMIDLTVGAPPVPADHWQRMQLVATRRFDIMACRSGDAFGHIPVGCCHDR